MKIDISKVFENPGEVFESEQSSPFEGLTFQGERYEFSDGASMKASYFGDSEDGVTVMGSFRADTAVACSRCLKEFIYTIEFGFTEYYKKNPDDDTQYSYSGKTIDLDKMLSDNIILNLPQKFLCEQQCKGLCPRCGRNQNEGPCGCNDKPKENSPFYGLKDFFDD